MHSVLCVQSYTCSATILFMTSLFDNFTVVSTIDFLMHIILPQIIHMHEFRIACLINIESILLYHGCFSFYGCDGTTYK